MLPIVSDPDWREHLMPAARVSHPSEREVTIIDNLGSIGAALERPAFHLLYFAGIYLGTGFEYDALQVGAKFTLLQRVPQGVIQEVIEIFIRMFVSCRYCSNPRTALTLVEGTWLLWKRCDLCDFQEYIRIDCFCDCDH